MDIKRVLIKISGEALSASDAVFDYTKILNLCKNIKNIIDSGVEVSIVIGGGNVIRGCSFKGINREAVDSMGMIATSINGIAIRACLEEIGVHSVIVSNLQLPFGIENSNFHNVCQYIKSKKVIIFVGGVGQPYFSTDTISIIAGVMTRSDIVLKATKPDGIYDKDPLKFDDAVHISVISHKEVIDKNIKVMDKTAFLMAMEYNMPIMVFSIKEPNCFEKAINKSIKHSLVVS